MVRRAAILALLAFLSGCGGPESTPESAPATPANPDEARAVTQLTARLGGAPTLSRLRRGTDDGKPVLCGEALVADHDAPTPFVLRNGYLVLPADASPAQFAALEAACTQGRP
jgi:hypothetical protein